MGFRACVYRHFHPATTFQRQSLAGTLCLRHWYFRFPSVWDCSSKSSPLIDTKLDNLRAKMASCSWSSGPRRLCIGGLCKKPRRFIDLPGVTSETIWSKVVTFVRPKGPNRQDSSQQTTCTFQELPMRLCRQSEYSFLPSALFGKHAEV